uniref:Uncharacterized protein n=1 Tax=Sphaeramia orbicularis TaxID=375764 RepID=A0A672Y3B9_9TELE
MNILFTAALKSIAISFRKPPLLNYGNQQLCNFVATIIFTGDAKLHVVIQGDVILLLTKIYTNSLTFGSGHYLFALIEKKT